MWRIRGSDCNLGKCLVVPGYDRKINQSSVPGLGERLLIIQLPGLLIMNYPGYTEIRLTESVGNSLGKRACLIGRGIIPSLLRELRSPVCRKIQLEESKKTAFDCQSQPYPPHIAYSVHSNRPQL